MRAAENNENRSMKQAKFYGFIKEQAIAPKNYSMNNKPYYLKKAEGNKDK